MTEQNPNSGPIWVDDETIKSSRSSGGACVGLRQGPEGLSLVDVIDMQVVPDLSVPLTLDALRQFIAGVKNNEFDRK